MRTDPIYLTDPYRKTFEAQVLEMLPESAKRFRVLLNQTVFYPMGGGQPTDQGTLGWQSTPAVDSNPLAKVYQVLLKDGEIWHYLELLSQDQPPLEVGQNVTGCIDWNRRYQNMKIHTGGHLIDFALFQLGLVPNMLKPLKGDHGKKPYVLYEGTLKDLHPEELAEKLNQTVKNLIEEKRKLKWEIVPLEELQKSAIYLQPGLPKNKPLRKLTLEGVGSVADGGTLLGSTGEVGNIKVKLIEDFGDQVKISYEL